MLARRISALLLVAAVVALAAWAAGREFGDPLLAALAGALAMLPALVAVSPFLESRPQSGARIRSVSRFRVPSRA